MAGYVSAVNGQPGRYRSSSITLTNGQGAALPLDASGNLITTSGGSGATATEVQGNIASGATDSGNPVKVGGKFNTIQPTFTDGQRGDIQISSRGAVIVALGSNNTIGATAPVSAMPIGGVDVGGNLQNVRMYDTGDGVTTKVLGVGNYIFNGTNTDRVRGLINGFNSVGTGVVASGIVAQLDDTSTGAVTENQFAPVRLGTARQLLTDRLSDYPYTATPITAASGNVANAAAVATLAAVSTKTTYITGFEITASGATVGAIVNVTVAGTITGTLTYTYAAPAGVLVLGTPLLVAFPTAIPASAANTTIVVTLPALGAGNTNATAVAHGYQL